MSNRDFEERAEAIRDLPDNYTRHVQALKAADYFARTNRKFDRERFLAACNLQRLNLPIR